MYSSNKRVDYGKAGQRQFMYVETSTKVMVEKSGTTRLHCAGDHLTLDKSRDSPSDPKLLGGDGTMGTIGNFSELLVLTRHNIGTWPNPVS